MEIHKISGFTVDQLSCSEILVSKLKVLMNTAKLAILKLKSSADLLTFL